MDKELYDEILDIIENMPNEGPILDYKEAPYFNYGKADFIKDVCAFLNCTESYGKNKFIIIGVDNKTKKRKGIPKDLMQDDNEYQDLCQKIQPRPHVETGIVDYKGDTYGYIYISKDNVERIYSIVEDYPPEKVLRQEEILNVKKKVYASTAFIRKGSVNYLLNEYDRRRIYEQDKESKKQDGLLFTRYSSPLIDEEKDIMKMCALVGTWNEKNQKEKDIIDALVGKNYEIWIKHLRKLLEQNSDYVTYKNNCWQINKREKLIERFSENYFPDDIKRFEEMSLKILAEQNPKFNLEPSQRYVSNIMWEEMIYSRQMKKEVLESFAILRSLQKKMINCEDQVKYSCWTIVQKLLDSSDWKMFASLDELLPVIAEIGEGEYIQQINKFINNNLDGFKQLIKEQDEFVTIRKYTSGLYWSLELLAWNPIYLMQSFDILSQISKYDKKAIEIMSRILLPWFPQTQADFTLRKATIEMVLSENEEIGWELLMQLMPKYQTVSFPTYKPKWNNKVDEKDSEVTKREVYEQYRDFIKLAIDYSNTNSNRIIQLVDVMDNVSQELFDLIFNKISSEEILKLPDTEKYGIWNRIEDLILKHKKYSNAKWVLPKEIIARLEELSLRIRPSKKEMYYKRYFAGNYWDLYEDKGGYEEQEQKLLLEQVNYISELLEDGINKVIEFGKSVKDGYRVGFALGDVGVKIKDEKIIIALLNTGDYIIAQGYVKRKFSKEGFEWLDSINIDYLSVKGKVNLLTQLPNNQNVWDKTKFILQDNELEYWKTVDIRFVEGGSEYNYAVEKLIEADRPIKGVELINMALYENRVFNRELSARALQCSIDSQYDFNQIDIYDIKKVIKDLQDNDYNKDELFKIEWAYLPLLSYDEEYRPITIEKRLSEDPEIYMQIICLAFKSRDNKENIQDNDLKLATNAYRLLEIWKTVPGTNDDGIIDKEKINEWLVKMKKLATEMDRVEVALHYFGEVLIFAPKDTDGFWIDKSVATILNAKDADEIRKGYSIKVFNSVGMVNLDEEGTVWNELGEKWERRAEETQIMYHRFANKLRDISNNFFAQAEYQNKHYEF